MHRLTLIRHATTAAVRSSAFPSDEPLDDAGRAEAAALRGLTGRGDALCGPSTRARETAELLGLDPTTDRALDECDFGTWRGRTLAELHDERPQDVAAWLQDPLSSPHGGESLAVFAERVSRWLDRRAAVDGSTIAVTSGGVVRAAVVHALGAGLDATWRIDATPLHATVLHAHDGRWTVRAVNRPMHAPPVLGSSALSRRRAPQVRP
jgi:broad specificity phosphatase PhoE